MSLPEIENPLQTALNDYHRMAEEVQKVRAHNRDLITENSKLASEAAMLREMLLISDRDRMRLQAVASTFGGQARSLSAIFNDIMTLAIKNGIEAAEMHRPAAEPTAEPAQVLVQKVSGGVGTPEPAAPDPSPAPPKAVLSPVPPAVDWTRLPQGQGEPYQFRNGR